MKRFVSILKTVLLIGGRALPAVVAQVNPVLGTLLGVAVNAILQAEAQYGPGQGAAKMELAQHIVTGATPVVIQTAETSLGRELADEELFSQGMQKVLSGVVDLMNAFAVLPRSQKPA